MIVEECGKKEVKMKMNLEDIKMYMEIAKMTTEKR